jgi:hypothetical protein
MPDDTILNITLKKAGPPAAAGPVVPQPEPQLRFRGPAATPLLAPRGVCLAAGGLYVSDTGRNRVFIWRQLPQAEQAEPDVVLGQEDAFGTGRNAGGTASAVSLQYPSGLWSDGQRLIVADAWNHRVLIWHELPTRSGQPADVVLGQPDFTAHLPNARGVGAAPTERSLFWPYGLHSDGQRLWVADTGNRRVLYYETIPQENYAPAQGVIGKPDFYTRDYESADAIWPYSVKIGPQGALAIADTQYYRVLLWQDWRRAFAHKADCVIGQPDLAANGMNQYGLAPAAHTLSWCYDACFTPEGLLVADAGNSRILRFEPLPQLSNPSASGLIGKPDFSTGSENAETVWGTEKNLYWPFAVSAAAGWLAVADTGNHRIVLYGKSNGS